MTRIANKQDNTIHNEEPSHSIKTDPELAHMLEIDDDMKTYYNYNCRYSKSYAETWNNPKKNKED